MFLFEFSPVSLPDQNARNLAPELCQDIRKQDQSPRCDSRASLVRQGPENDGLYSFLGSLGGGLFPVILATRYPKRNPKTSTKGIRMIWDMDIFQKYNRKDITCVFCMRKIANKMPNTTAEITLGFFIVPPSPDEAFRLSWPRA
jgi:hypothetical protein